MSHGNPVVGIAEDSTAGHVRQGPPGRRESDTTNIVRHILGVPLKAWSLIATLTVAGASLWLTHDRAIAATAKDVGSVMSRTKTLEDHERDRVKDDREAAEKKAEAERQLAQTLGRMEGKIDGLKGSIDDVKDRVTRMENRGSH